MRFDVSEKGRALITEGDAVAHCGIVLRGLLRSTRLVARGRQILSIHMKGIW